MGIFTGESRITSTTNEDVQNIQIGCDETAIGESAIKDILIESVKNDLSLFDAIIEADFREVCSKINESGDVSELRAIHEATIGDIVKKVIDFIVSIGSKIAGLISNAITAIQSRVGKDNENLVKKCSKDIAGKDLSSLKYDWRTNKNDPNVVMDMDKVISIKGLNESITSPVDYEKAMEKMADAEPQTVDQLLSNLVGRTVLATNIKTELEEQELEASKLTEGLSQERVKGIEDFLLSYGDFTKDLKEMKTKFEKLNKQRIKDIKEVEKSLKNKEGEDVEKLYKGANVILSNAKREQEAVSIYVGSVLSIYKELVIMARKAYITAAKAKGMGGVDEEVVEENVLLRFETDVDANNIEEYFEDTYI